MPPRPARQPARRRWSVWTGLGYLLISLGLVGWELHEQAGLFSSDACGLRSTSQAESPLMKPLYSAIVLHATPKVSDRVSVVAIDASLQTLQQNVCLARAFTADLLTAIAAQRPSVIAVDRFYGPTSCPPDDPSTQKLRDTFDSLAIPAVVGESTNATEKKPAAACLVLTPQLDLGTRVHHGLTRLDEDVLRLPLRWPVLAKVGDAKPSTGPESESFALTTATLQDASFRNERAFTATLAVPQQPYANLTGTLDRQTATAVLCHAPNAAALEKTWSLDCSQAGGTQDLRGKVVVVGAESASDTQDVLGADMYGFDLQAPYVAALLSGSYLRPISPLFLLIPLALYFGLAELLVPYLHIHHKVRWPMFHVRRPLRWTLAIYGTSMIVGLFLPLAFGRFPPLGVLLEVSGILIPRLLIESWALLNEHREAMQEGHEA